MSTLKVTNLQHPSSASANVTLDSSGNADFNGKNLAGVASVNGGALNSANLVTNGAMTVAQRGVSTTGVGDGTVGYLTVDRFRVQKAGSPTARYTMTQDSNAPDGFGSSLKLAVTTADTSVASTSLQYVDQFIEAQNLQQLAYGTSAAKTITLSFYVRCSTAQTFALDLINEDNSRYFNTTYTVSSVDTWERIVITIPADTTSGFNNDNGRGLRVRWTLVAGSDFTGGSVSTAWSGTQNTATNHENTWVATLGATWQLTGVMLETGDTATSYPHEDVGTTLSKCQRYFWRFTASSTQYIMIMQCTSSTGALGMFEFPCSMRTKPTMSVSAASHFQAGTASGSLTSSATSITFASHDNQHLRLSITVPSGLSAGNASYLRMDANRYIDADAEL